MGLRTALFIGFLSLATLNVAFCNGGCKESEKQALLQLKKDMVDPANRLASWVADDEDCCRWEGVVCDNVTGHVLELNLNNVNDDQLEAQLGGKISPSLLRLKHLRYLDLSNNHFEGIHIPKFFGSLKSLRILNLSHSGFEGEVPHHLGNLSNLKYLNLQNTNGNLQVENFQWLSGLSSLEYLDLTSVNLWKASNWFYFINTLPSLVELRLSSCHLESHYLVPPFTSVNLSSLVVLDLSDNHFHYLSEVKWVFGLNKLIFLDLDRNQFQGPIPYDLQNLTLLRHLDLSGNDFNSSIPDWLDNFSHLEFLSLAYNNFEGKIPIRSIGKLCNLSSLDFYDLSLSLKISHILEILSVGCISNSLETLTLGKCQLSGQLPNQFGNFKSLKTLDLSDNSISGPIPISIAELQSLEYLYLYGNKLNGNLPESFGQLANLKKVDISNNSFDGNLPESLGQLTNLQHVDISQNSFNGTITEIHFLNLKKLYNFIADGNPSMILKVNFDWVPHFQIKMLRLGSWHLGLQFPQWLLSQKHITHLDISDSKIVDTIPSWFWQISFQCVYINISHNQIRGHLPSNLNVFSPIDPFDVGTITIDFSSNNFNGPLSHISSNVSFLDLSDNNLSGSLFHFLCHERNETMAMIFLNLGQNFLSGELPDCWTKWPYLWAIVLADNKLTGEIPRSIGTLSSLRSLHLQKNYLSGEIPLSLSNCTNLKMLQLGENELDGCIPPWMGTSLSDLIILNLGSNEFSGHIPNELCSLNSLQILDLADNNLFGSLPRCFDNISVLLSSENHSEWSGSFWLFLYGNMFEVTYHEIAFVSIKGQLLEYGNTLHLVKVMDFSGNSLSGEIPSEITCLQGLQSLNLSHNLFTGRIPRNIGNMRMLESIDFSGNKLSSSIPESMSSLAFLSYLNLSNNQLIGQIPSGTQLQSFNASSYVGNKLCGLPLPNKCSVNGSFVPNIQNRGGKDGNGVEIIWLFVSIALGFIGGFWSVLVPLVISSTWRHMYYQFLEEMWWKINDSVKKCF